MKKENNKWDLHRMPTKIEKIYGSLLALLILLLSLALLFISTSNLFTTEILSLSEIIFFGAALIFSFVSSFLFLRMAFTKPRKLSHKAAVIIGYLILTISSIFIALAMIGIGNALQLASIGLVGFGGGILVINKSRSHGVIN